MGKYVVTGGNGYIGSHMCKYLSSFGHQVIIIDNHSTSPRENVHDFYDEFQHLDIGDKDKVQTVLEKEKPDALFHFAAKCLVPEGEEKPIYYYRENFSKTLNLMEACIDAGLKKFIFSSTCATFGVPTTDTLAEDHSQNPINTYGHSKKLMELAMRDLAAKGKLDVMVFRYFNAAGCSPDGDIGENHDPETHLIPNLCKAHLSGGEIPFSLFGTNYPTRDGTCIRDYIHVDDLARVHFAGAKFLENNEGFHDYNLGTESGSSVREVVSCFEKVTGSKLALEEKDPRPGDPPSLVANSAKAKRDLDFKCEYSLEDSIRHTLKYLQTL